MLAAFLLAVREGLEAALIIGIVLSALRQTQRRELVPAVWTGVLAALLVCSGVALGLNSLGLRLEGAAEQIFEGITMLLAAALLTWMIFWLSRQAPGLKADLEAGTRRASQAGWWSLCGLAFLAVLREGVELALFLTAASLTAGAQPTLIGALLGLAVAVLLGLLAFASTVRLDMQAFFRVTGFLLLLFSAGLVAHGIHEFNEVGWIPALIAPVWDLNPVLDEGSVPGMLLKALFGYNGNPSLTEVLAYGLYCAAVLLGLRAAGGAGRARAVQGTV